MYAIEAFNRVLNLEIVVYLLAGLAGVLLIRLFMRGQENQSRAVSEAWNAVILWLAVWKGSLVLFDWESFRHDWRSLLYFSGGSAGMWLAAAAAGVYLIVRSGLRRGLERLFILSLGWTAAVQFSYVLFDAGSAVRHAAIVLFVFIVGYALWRGREQAEWRRTVSLACLYGLGMMALQYVDFSATKVSYSATGGIEQGVKVGQRAADFTLTNLEGESVRLSDYAGQPVMINFWATWCPPCKVEMPHLQKLHEDYEDEGLTVLSVNLTSTERGSANVGSFVEREGLSFPVLLDAEGQVQEQYRIKGYPTSVFVGRSGVIEERIPGALDYNGMKAVIARMLE
ncbi:peroxiredoxin [Paenibacillus phyllosphaerae]|uniref:Peroxiredoxin n=1 Tax=Paenibacillus phyllosphaerae TaxID=274593 RepID=A0A7W5FML7_9BACL|nr:TlpA disulfide reductase family protein [Paenibacillus phyllosphaerae]MBB3110263.1 peroxiredoxin [Paenibacillus phyllosphaerae]